MQNYDKFQIERFYRYIIDDYNRNLFIEKIAQVDIADEINKTFTKTCVWRLVDRTPTPNFISIFRTAGSDIALEERDFLIRTLLKDKDIKRVRINKKDFNAEALQKEIEHLESKILISTNLNILLLKDIDWRKYIDYCGSNTRFYSQHDLFPIPNKILKNKIIILDDLSLFWKKQGFHNKITKKTEKIDISIGELRSDGKVEVIIRSVNKLDIPHKEKVKIIEVI